MEAADSSIVDSVWHNSICNISTQHTKGRSVGDEGK